jgi:glycosyltransferase involved in cell wall biosynthesis
MAEAILRLINNKDLARRMGEAGRRRVEERFSLDRMVRESEQVYEECLARRKHVGRWKIDGR